MTTETRKLIPTDPAGIVSLLAVLAATVYVAVTEVIHALPKTLGYDEAWHVYVAIVSPLWKTALALSADTHPPLYYPPLRALARIGNDPFWPRLLSLVPTVLCVPLWYALQRKLRIHVVVAVATTIVLASSYSFLHVGVLVRAYAPTGFLLLAALWFWLDMLPGSSGRPRRAASLMGLLVFSLAFGFLYAGVFATAAIIGATMLTMLLTTTGRSTVSADWLRYSRWPEWLAFMLFHLLIVIWFYVGWGSHVNANMPLYLSNFSQQPGQSIGDFLIAATRLETALFTPLAGFPNWALDLGAALIAATALLLTVGNLRAGNLARAVVALSPMLLVAILAGMALLGKYPYGGELRHQYVLFPLLLLLLPLAMDALWRRLPHWSLRSLMVTLVLAVAIANAIHMRNHHRIEEAPPVERWSKPFKALFAKHRDEPVFVNAYVFYPTYMNRRRHGVWYQSSYQLSRQGTYYTAHQGWLSILLPWTPFEEYGAMTDDGGSVTFVRDRYRFHFYTMPDRRFFNEVRGVLKAMGKDQATFFAVSEDPSKPLDPEAIRRHAAQFGFEVTAVEEVDGIVLWTVQVGPEPAAMPEK